MAKASVLRDAVHGDVYLTHEELAILDTPQMQRLRGVRQLGTAYLVYPSAQHSRFEHSIGVAEMARTMIESINRNAASEPAELLGVPEREERIIRIAALVHDCTHVPFGHGIEDQSALFPRHDSAYRFEERFSEKGELGRALRSIGVHEEVLAVLSPDRRAARPVPPYWSQILSDTIDADVFDYLRRDALFTGLNLHYDARVLAYFKVDRRSGNLFVDLAKHRMLREDILSEIVRVLEARYYFSERVYYHHAKVAAGALLSKAVEHAMTAGALAEKELYDTTDSTLLDRLEAAPIRDPAIRSRVRELTSRFRSRRLLKRACVYPLETNRGVADRLVAQYFSPERFEARVALERRIAETVEVATGRRGLEVVVYCPRRSMQLKEARLHVRWPGVPEVAPLSEFAHHVPRLRDLEESYRNLWKFYVFVSSDEPAVLRKTREVCETELPGAVSAYDPPSE
ncbi:MAG TPA: HD domain-containing protein [Planctomycetota bacterium]|nr:HD domain-containing protein [Planctomycetota bacterium]